MNYKKYRIFLNTPGGNFIVAASNTVNDLVDLTRAWLTTTTAGQYLPENVKGYLILQMLDEVTGAYMGGEKVPFEDKDDIITQLRIIGGR